MKDLKQCRIEIDAIDQQLMELFEKRMALSKSVVEYKIENNLEIFQHEREREVIEEYLCNYEINKGVSTEIAKFYAKEICEALNLTEVINIVVDKVIAEDKKIKTIR